MTSFAFAQTMRPEALTTLRSMGAAELTLARHTAGTFDPRTNTTTGGATLTATVLAAVLPITPRRDETREEALARTRRRAVVIAALAPDGSAPIAFEPQDGDVLQLGAADWPLSAVSPIGAPAGEAVAYEAEIGR